MLDQAKFDQFLGTLKFPPNPFQLKVLESIAFGSGNIVVSALAGSGKTSLLVQTASLLAAMGDASATYLAFNVKIKEELNERLPKPYAAINSHSLGLRMLNSVRKTNVDKNKWRGLTENVIEDEHFAQDEQYTARQMLEKLCSKVMLNKIDLDNPDAIMEVALRYRIADEDDPDITKRVLKLVKRTILRATEIWKNTGAINFDEMIYLPVVQNIQPPKFRWVFVDECLPYQTPVQLADGTSLPIGEIVEKELPVTVLAYDTSTGQQKACRVTKWSKTLNQKPLVKIKARWTQRKGTNTPHNFVVCTVDHKIWANGQWIYAGDIKPGMQVQIETSAIKSQAYKITSTGRKTLSIEMSSKNEQGSMIHDYASREISKRGGNGTGFTLPQWTLWQALGDGWHPEYTVPTKVPQGNGYPTSYKIDIANPDRMIAIEVDGGSHKSPKRKVQDEKKRNLLEAKGWRVIHISNRDAIQKTSECIRQINSCEGTDCPIDAIVVSVEPVELPDYFVYDITVENCHNFYANGILVHNCQDLNVLQQQIAFRSIADGGRFVAVGDVRQAIYGFSGADAASFDRIIEHTKAIVYPLNICYRCPKSSIELAKALVPAIEAAPNAAEGIVEYADETDLYKLATKGSLVMCRLNAPLISAYFKLIGNRIPAKVMGKDIGRDLAQTLDKVANFDGFRYERMIEYLEKYREQQTAMIVQKKNSESQLEILNDKVACLIVCVQNFNCSTLQCLKEVLEDLFGDDDKENWNNLVALCTVHKAKGLEADNTFILRPDKMPLVWPNQAAWELEQEYNIKYVALTRAKKSLTILGPKPLPMPVVLPAPLPTTPALVSPVRENPVVVEVKSPLPTLEPVNPLPPNGKPLFDTLKANFMAAAVPVQEPKPQQEQLPLMPPEPSPLLKIISTMSAEEIRKVIAVLEAAAQEKEAVA